MTGVRVIDVMTRIAPFSPVPHRLYHGLASEQNANRPPPSAESDQLSARLYRSAASGSNWKSDEARGEGDWSHWRMRTPDRSRLGDKNVRLVNLF